MHHLIPIYSLKIGLKWKLRSIGLYAGTVHRVKFHFESNPARGQVLPQTGPFVIKFNHTPTHVHPKLSLECLLPLFVAPSVLLGYLQWHNLVQSLCREALRFGLFH